MQIYDGSKDKKALPTKHTISVVSANRVVQGEKDFMTVRKNGREDWSLFYCEEGRLVFEDMVLKEDMIWIYPPKTPQKYILYGKDNTIYHYLHFTGSDVENLLRSLGINLLMPIEANRQMVLKAFNNIETAMLTENTISKLTAEYNTLYLISRIAKEKTKDSKVGGMKRVLDDMQHSFARKYEASYYAEMLNLSVGRFNHLFKEYIGQSPYMYLLNLRIDNAAALLEETDNKIKDIAEQCGFEDPLYFTQVFKRLRGNTPSEYRKTKGLGD